MQVVRLEIFGFKSFMEKIVIPVGEGVTGIVGPNGCGKSNVVDALMWVLGETRARKIRGGSLDDLIFNGTEKLRPLGLAEVSITIRSSGADILQDITTSVHIDQELFAIKEALGESKIALGVGEVSEEIDQSRSEANAEVLSISSIGAPQNNIDSQGTVNIDDIIEESSDQAVSEISEAQVLDKQIANDSPWAAFVHRFAWLKSVNEIQVTRRYYRSGESEYFINRVPCRLRDLSELFQAMGLGPRAYTIVAQDKVARLVTSKPEERRMVLEEAAGVHGFRDKIGAATRRLEDTSNNILRLSDIITEVTRQVGGLKRQAQRAINRKGLLEEILSAEKGILGDRYINIDSKIGELKGILEAKRLSFDGINAEFAKYNTEEERAKAELLTVDREGDLVRSKLDRIKDELHSRQFKTQKQRSRISEINSLVQSKEGELVKLNDQEVMLKDRLTHAERSVEALTLNLEEVMKEIRSIDAKDDGTLPQLVSKLKNLRHTLRTKEEELRRVRDRVVSHSTQLEAMERQIASKSPIAKLKKSIVERGGQLNIDVNEVFISGIGFSSEIQDAVRAVLSERASFGMSESPKTVAQLLSQSPEAKGLALGVVKKGEASINEPPLTIQLERGEVTLQPLSSLLQIKTEYTLGAARFFKGVYLADSLVDAFDVSMAINNPELTFVTRDGAVVTSTSFHRFGDDRDVLELKRKANEISQQLKVAEASHASISGDKDEISAQILANEEQYELGLRESQKRSEVIRELTKNQGDINGRLSAEKRLRDQIRGDLSRIDSQKRNVVVSVQSLKSEGANIEVELQNYSPEKDEQMKQEILTFQHEINRIEAIRREGRNKLGSISEQVAQIRRKLDNLRSEVNNADITLEKALIEAESLTTRIKEICGEEFLLQIKEADNTSLILSDEKRAELQRDLLKSKDKLHREGDVDPTSIERYDEESKRLENLIKQRDDLESASLTLKSTIEKLCSVSRDRFLTTFNEVNDHFGKLVPRLFGGGSARLELSDPLNPLDSGVEIVAKPPGKKLRGVDVLSGGEKALCATALVFSMFLVRPSPLCVLDEVDAPLDDANVIRFLNLIKEMSKQVQFIMITHNKQSMAIADRLLGVTMEQPGLSKTISVSLEEAFKKVA